MSRNQHGLCIRIKMFLCFLLLFIHVLLFDFWQLTDSDSEAAGSLSGDTLMRSGSAGMTSIIKPIKEGYLTKKGAVVGAVIKVEKID